MPQFFQEHIRSFILHIHEAFTKIVSARDQNRGGDAQSLVDRAQSGLRWKHPGCCLSCVLRSGNRFKKKGSEATKQSLEAIFAAGARTSF